MQKLADGNAPRREKLIDYNDNRAGGDYNTVLHNLIRSRQQGHYTISQIRDIPDITLRAKAALLYAEIPAKRAAALLGCSLRTFYRRISRVK